MLRTLTVVAALLVTSILVIPTASLADAPDVEMAATA
jgi:hypothetical protein